MSSISSCLDYPFSGPVTGQPSRHSLSVFSPLISPFSKCHITLASGLKQGFSILILTFLTQSFLLLLWDSVLYSEHLYAVPTDAYKLTQLVQPERSLDTDNCTPKVENEYSFKPLFWYMHSLFWQNSEKKKCRLEIWRPYMLKKIPLFCLI